MTQPNQNFLKICRYPRGRVVRTLFLLLTAVLLLTPLGQGAKPGGVPVLLPPFIPVPAPQNFLPGVSPFAIIGFIQSATLDSTTDAFSGGTLLVNGIKITVPRNTIFQMPAAAMTWSDLFANAPNAYKTIGQTGLALSDTPKPLTTYEVNVMGNRVISPGADNYIAGLIFISNQSVNSGQGFINFIDYVKSEIWVSQTLTAGPAGARIRLNTPNGRYGVKDSNADIRFTSDEDNPTITARTGYPMCIPRIDPKVNSDSLCPLWNRPVDPYTGAFSTNFTMSPATANATPDAAGITHQVGYPNSQAVKPDPFEQVPFEIGDYLTYAGTLTVDSIGGQYISAHTVTADIGVFTAPGTWPVYVSMGEFRIGVGGTPNPIIPQEGLEKVFGDFFTTDSSALVDIYAVDVDPCTGARTHRYYGTSNPFGPPLGGLKGRARFRTTIGNFLPPTREMAVSSRSLTGNTTLDSLGTLKLTANGLSAGTFQAPQFQFIFPENLVIGSPQVPLTFQEFPFLLNGFGPYVPFGAPAGAAPVGTIGQLSPWPSVTAPVPSCTIGLTLLQPPISNAGAPQTVASDASVVLDGSASADTNNPPLSLIYTWAQSAGPSVSLLAASLQKTHFKAPTVAVGAAPVLLSFQLAVCNGFTCGGISSVDVTVTPPVAPPPPPPALLSVKLTAAPAAGLHQSSAVSLNAAVTGGTGPYTYTFTETDNFPTKQQLKTPGGAIATFTVDLGAPVPAVPTTLTFLVSVTDSSIPKQTQTSPVSVVVGAADTITVTSVVYTLSKSRLQVAASTNALPKGAAVLTVTPIGTSVPISSASSFITILTSTSPHGLPIGSTQNMTIAGAKGSWTPVNGTFAARVVDANRFSIPVDSSKFGPLAGNLTFSSPSKSGNIAAAAPSPTTVFTSVNHGFAIGSTPTVTIVGATLKWAPVNGTFAVQVVDANRFSIPVDSSAFGALTGTLSYTQSLGPDVVCTYDPTLDTYNILADIVNPGPDSVRIRSSYGDTIVAPTTKVK